MIEPKKQYINLAGLTYEAYVKLKDIDEQLIGTADYIGVCYFWAHRYRHDMRHTTIAKRVKVHKAFVDAGLITWGETRAHDQIVDRIMGSDYSRRWPAARRYRRDGLA